MPDLFFNREAMWFGTEAKMGWIETPQTGADVSPAGFSAEATYLNGGGFARNSWDSHKVYQFSWGNSASLDLAAKLQAYAHGTYGRTPIYFHDPMYYQTNILPRRWSDPSMAINYEAAPLINDLWPTGVATGANSNDLPVTTAVYAVPAGYDAQTAGDELFIPIPTGFTLRLGAVHSTANILANLYYRTSAAPTTKVAMTATAQTATSLIPHSITTSTWVRVGLRNTGVVPYNVSITAMMAKLVPPGEALVGTAPWMTGEGHSGCTMSRPTLINYNGVNGGQVGIACTLTETGAWEV